MSIIKLDGSPYIQSEQSRAEWAHQYAARVRQHLPVNQEAAFKLWQEHQNDTCRAMLNILENWEKS